MVISPQYYQYLYEHKVAPAVQTDDGGYTKQTDEWVFVGMCREETNGKGSMIKTQDGQQRVFSSLVQVPQGQQRIAEGSEIIVSNKALDCSSIDGNEQSLRHEGIIVLQGRCMKYDAGRLHNRMWI